MSCLTCRNCGFVNAVPLEPQLQNITAIQSSDNFVSQILRGSRPLLDSDHILFNAEIHKLDLLRSLYNAQLQEIQLHWCTVLKALENRQSIFAPIRRLPRDILIEIFHSVCDPWTLKVDYARRPEHHSLDVSGPLWVLGRVCGLWRDTLHTSPASWARNVVVTSPYSRHAPEILQTYLERTGDHPLSLMVICEGINRTREGEIMTLLVQSCNRWKNVHIGTDLHHIHHLESITDLPALQRIELDSADDYRSNYRLDICLNAPQLWKVSLLSQGMHQVRLPPSVTHYSGLITCAEDSQFLSHLPKLETCHLQLFWEPSVKIQVEAPVVVAELRHLYVDHADLLNFITAPLLQSLTISKGQIEQSACVTSFFRRSGCHLESLSYSLRRTPSASKPSALISNMLSSEACSTISRLKLELGDRFDEVAQALTPSSVLHNLHHLILCVRTPVEKRDWYPIPNMIRSRRDVGVLRTVELQFNGELFLNDTYEDWEPIRNSEIKEDVRALTGDNLEMRVERWDPPSHEHLLIFSSDVIQ
ncbi:hypothetical protein ARMSODRAFT_955487 [Armillaria solidipes]|uniref:F-box domain-containing protein n=1 Tax=Armillaria solidipes TaxID=1076256 RepID=A0A2H3C1L4_9AGAR|nr:hypothetical protein ARMSODRAFT_955487 [Armillaria solidipes]